MYDKICWVAGYRFRYTEIDRKNCEAFYLEWLTQLKIDSFPHMLDRVWISDKDHV